MMTVTPSPTPSPATLTLTTHFDSVPPGWRIPTERDDQEWVALPGGELEAPRPSTPGVPGAREAAWSRATTCRACRDRRQGRSGNEPSSEHPPLLCFACYRLGIERDLKLRAARELHTASDARFQISLPFEPVNRARLNQLRAARGEARAAERSGAGRYTDRRRRAQIEARHALQRLAEGLKARGLVLDGDVHGRPRSAVAVRY